MAASILALAGTPRNLTDLTDDQLTALAEEPEFLAGCTPLELELIVRLGAGLEVHRGGEEARQAEIDRLEAYEPVPVKEARQKAAGERLEVLVAMAESRREGRTVRVGS